tara:strand:- start:6210 stop:6605 length:396 start_codon:yes stop_codon:yes gene_type:complete
MDLKSQFTIYLIIFLIMMYIIGVASNYIFNYSIFIVLFYLFSSLVRDNSYLMVLSFCCLILYGIYNFQKNTILEEGFSNYYTFPNSIYQNLLSSIRRHSKFNPNDNVVLYPDSYYYLEDITQHHPSHFLKY